MLINLLKFRFKNALQGWIDDPHAVLDLIRPSQDPKFGDFQANLAMPLGKQLGRPPREIAAEILKGLEIGDLCTEPEIAGPGFINLRLRDNVLAEFLQKALADRDRLAVPLLGEAEKKRILVDYSAPNVAKAMHVGHIRSTVIGNALAHILKFLGHEVITDNHIGEWGTQFGMIIYGYRHFLDRTAYEANPVLELSRLYREVRRRVDEPGSTLGPLVLEETAKLHHGDPENLALWNEFVPVCMQEIDRMYKRLGIRFDHTLGESFYQPMLAPLVEELLKNGIARETEGAVGVFLEGEEVPMLIRKKDGAFLYSTTDWATIRYRIREFRPDTILYVVDFRQSHHFQQLFAAAGKTEAHPPELVHVKFGTVLGDDGKAFKTRSGDTVGLESLLDEAEQRAFQIVAANDDAKPVEAGLLTEDERRETARRIGIGALIYADLSQNRESDYVFSFDKMLAMNGNTATYMQYAYARVQSIFGKGNCDPETLRDLKEPIRLNDPRERALALELLKFDEALESAVRDFRPNQLTAYLFELANRYSTFFEQCPVLRAESESVKTDRLRLCDLTARTIRKGLELLGIQTVERM